MKFYENLGKKKEINGKLINWFKIEPNSLTKDGKLEKK